MARTKQTARKSTGGMAPRRQLAAFGGGGGFGGMQFARTAASEEVPADDEFDVPMLARTVSVYAREQIKQMLQQQYSAKMNLFVDFSTLLDEARGAVQDCLPRDPNAFVDAYIQARLAQAATGMQAEQEKAAREAGKAEGAGPVLTCPYCLSVVHDTGVDAAAASAAASGGDARPRTLREVTSREREELRCATCENVSERCVLREHTLSGEETREEIRAIMKRDYVKRHHFEVLWTQAKRALLRAKPRPKNPYAFLAAFFRRFDEQIASQADEVLSDSKERRAAAIASGQAAAAAAGQGGDAAGAVKSKLDHLVDAITSQLSEQRPEDEDRVFHKVTPMRWKTAGRINEDYCRRHRLDEWWREHAVVGLNREMPGNPFLFLAARLDVTSAHYVRRIEVAHLKKQQRQVEVDEMSQRYPSRAREEQPQAVALAEQMSELAAAGDAAGLDALLAPLLAEPQGLIRAHQALGLVEYLTLTAAAACPSVKACEAVADRLSPAAVDRAIQRSDNRMRVLYVRERDSSPEVADLALGCVDVFASPHVMVCEEAEPAATLPRLCDWGQPHVAARPAAGQPSCVGRADFGRRFRAFHNGVLDGLDWSNVCVAGGSVMAALQPSPSQDHPHEFFSPLYDSSDIDLFLYGLTPEEANEKIRYLDSFFRRQGDRAARDALSAALPTDLVNVVASYAQHPERSGEEEHSLLVVRTTSAVTWTLNYPDRHVQVVLRLYKSPAEVVLGFDVDSCSVAYDGSRVLATPRAVRALNRGYNLVDMSRRSYTYEQRLLKYSKRGFAVAVRGLDESRLDDSVRGRRSTEMRGLARLLALEAGTRRDLEAGGSLGLAPPEDAPASEALLPEVYGEELKKNPANKPKTNRWGYYSTSARLEDALYQPLTDLAQAARRDEYDAEHEPERASEYTSVFLPRSSKVACVDVRRHLLVKYYAMNPRGWQASRSRRCPCFFSWTIEGVLRDEWHVDSPPALVSEMKADDTFVVGPLEWITVNPGRQMIGSFYAITDGDWFGTAYKAADAPATAEAKEDETAQQALAQAADKPAQVTDALVADLLRLSIREMGGDAGDPTAQQEQAQQQQQQQQTTAAPAAVAAVGEDDPFLTSALADTSWRCVLCEFPNVGGDGVCAMCGTRNLRTVLNVQLVELDRGRKAKDEDDDDSDEEEQKKEE